MSGRVGFHHFQHRDHHYVYDPRVNEVCLVSAAVVDLLGFHLSDDATISTRERRDADAEIDIARASGLFRSFATPRLEVCRSCYDEEGFATGLSQLTLSLTERCNLRCEYCPHTHDGLTWQRAHSDREMSREVMTRALRYFLPRSVGAEHASVSFYGGEPLLAFERVKDAVAIIEAETPRPDLRIIVDTNGLLLRDEQILAFLIEHRLHLQISLDGPAAIHDRHRLRGDGGASHAVVMEGIRALLARDPAACDRLRLQATVVDAGELDEIGAWFAAFPPYRELGIEGVPHVGVNLADLSGVDPGEPWLRVVDLTARSRHLSESRERYVKVRRRGEDPDPVARALFDGDLIRFFHRSRDAIGETVSPAGFCIAGRRRLHVTANGEFQPCERVGRVLMIGNVEEGINAGTAEDLVDGFVEAQRERCRTCWAVRLCTVCATSLVNGTEVPEAVCENVRRSREDVLRLWVDLVAAGDEAMAFLKNSTVG